MPSLRLCTVNRAPVAHPEVERVMLNVRLMLGLVVGEVAAAGAAAAAVIAVIDHAALVAKLRRLTLVTGFS